MKINENATKQSLNDEVHHKPKEYTLLNRSLCFQLEKKPLLLVVIEPACLPPMKDIQDLTTPST